MAVLRAGYLIGRQANLLSPIPTSIVGPKVVTIEAYAYVLLGSHAEVKLRAKHKDRRFVEDLRCDIHDARWELELLLWEIIHSWGLSIPFAEAYPWMDAVVARLEPVHGR